MNELIQVTYKNNRPTVLGRDLHDLLGVKTAYKDWFPRMVEYGFTEGQDFNPLKIERVQLEGAREVKREMHDHQLTIDMAKEICMLQRTEKGKQARQYFIQLEKDWNSPEKVMARALQIAQEELNSLKLTVIELEHQSEKDKPKVLFADAVTASHTSILVGELAKILKQNAIDIGQNRLFAILRDRGYLIRLKGSDWNMPTQRSMEMKLFEIKETVISHADGHTSVSKTVKVTGAGQQYFINMFLQERLKFEKERVK